MKVLDLFNYYSASAGGGYSEELRAVLSVAQTREYAMPSSATLTAWDDFLKKRVADGSYERIKALYNFAWNNSVLSDFSALNNKNPENNQAEYVSSPTHLEGGIQGNGSSGVTSYTKTNFNPSLDDGYQQDDACFGGYVYSAPTTGLRLFGTLVSNNNDIVYTDALNIHKINSSANFTGGVINLASLGYKAMNRTSSSAIQIYDNLNQYERTAASATEVDDVFCIGKTQTGQSNAVISMFYAGASLTEEQHNNICNDYKVFLIEIGLGIGSLDLLDAGGEYDVDNHSIIQSMIDDNPGVLLKIGGDTEDLILLSQPLILAANTHLVINGTLKLTDGAVKALTQDAAVGQNRVYVDNADGAFQVGQWLSVTDNTYPTGGGGSVARILAQCAKVTAATSTYVDFEYNLRNNLGGITVSDILMANDATIGHSQTMFYARDIDDISIRGAGLISGNYPTMHNYHPCAMGGDTAAVAGYETTMGGNGIVFSNCENITVDGVSMEEFNIGGILAVEVENYNFSNLDIYHPYMKPIAFSLGSNNGLCENNNLDTSYNEDGLSLHDNVTNSTFKNFTISNCPRIGLLIGTGTHHNYFENININMCGLSMYTLPGASDEGANNNYFKDVTITEGIAGLIITMTQDTTYENLNISFGRAGNHCITIGGECQNIIFNGGGCYDTASIHSNSGWGFRTIPKEAYHDYESSNIVVNNFEFKRLNRGIVDLGNFSVTFNNCTFDDNDDNGDLTSPNFTLVDCTVDGEPYP